MEFGPYLKARRHAAHLSLRQLGSKVGVSAATLLRMERGTSEATVEVAGKVAKAVGDTPLQFLTAYFTPREYRAWVEKEN